MAKYPGLMRRKARWYLRAKVPADLITFLGRAEIWQSLRTGEHREAVRRYTAARAKLQHWFDHQRCCRDAGERLDGEAPRLVTSWFHEQERRAAHIDFGLTGERRRSALGEVEEQLLDLVDGGAEEDVTAAVNATLIAAGWPARPHVIGSLSTRRTKVADGEVPAALPELVRRALTELARRRRDRLNGEPARVRDPMFNGSVPVQRGAEPAGDGGITLGELIERFEADRAPRIGFSKRVEYSLLFKALRELWGDQRPVRAITRADCRQIRDLFASLPPNSTKRWSRLSLQQAAERARAEGIAPLNPTTINSYMARLSTWFRWATREEFVERNPAEGLSVAVPELDPRDRRRPFSIDQLRLIFAAPPFVPRDDTGATFWAPLIALFGGLRLSEITGLAVADVTTLDGVDVLLVRPDPENGRRLKTPAARRIVPVHPELVAIGFLEYVARQRKAGSDHLFPELKLDRRGYRSDAIQKRLNRQIVRAGAVAPRTSFHSLRHNFRDGLREANVSRDAVLALGGWKAGGTEELYGGGLRPSTLARELAKIRYEGLDLSHLAASEVTHHNPKAASGINRARTSGSPGRAQVGVGRGRLISHFMAAPPFRARR